MKKYYLYDSGEDIMDSVITEMSGECEHTYMLKYINGSSELRIHIDDDLVTVVVDGNTLSLNFCDLGDLYQLLKLIGNNNPNFFTKYKILTDDE